MPNHKSYNIGSAQPTDFTIVHSLRRSLPLQLRSGQALSLVERAQDKSILY